MTTLNKIGLKTLKDWLDHHCKRPPINDEQLWAWAGEAERSCPPHIEITAKDSKSGHPVTMSFLPNEYDEYFEVQP